MPLLKKESLTCPHAQALTIVRFLLGTSADYKIYEGETNLHAFVDAARLALYLNFLVDLNFQPDFCTDFQSYNAPIGSRTAIIPLEGEKIFLCPLVLLK